MPINMNMRDGTIITVSAGLDMGPYVSPSGVVDDNFIQVVNGANPPERVAVFPTSLVQYALNTSL